MQFRTEILGGVADHLRHAASFWRMTRKVNRGNRWQRAVAWAVAASALCGLAGCGQKGPLYIPHPAAQPASANPPAAAAAPSPENTKNNSKQ